MSDGSVPGVTRFEKVLVQEGYEVGDFKVFNGSSILLYASTTPVTSLLNYALQWGDESGGRASHSAAKAKGRL